MLLRLFGENSLTLTAVRHALFRHHEWHYMTDTVRSVNSESDFRFVLLLPKKYLKLYDIAKVSRWIWLNCSVTTSLSYNDNFHTRVTTVFIQFLSLTKPNKLSFIFILKTNTNSLRRKAIFKHVYVRWCQAWSDLPIPIGAFSLRAILADSARPSFGINKNTTSHPSMLVQEIL